MTAKPNTITVPLNKLDRDPKNVRKTYSRKGIEELAASIRADGYRLLQDPIVRKGDKRGRYFVTAGGRRREALILLAELGEIAKDFPVECKLREDSNPIVVSLTENVMREGMDPVDQYRAFADMVADKVPVPDIAARFSVSEKIVKQRMALGRVNPELLDLYGQEEITYAQLAAFTVTDDHDLQMEVWESLPEWNRDEDNIREALTQEAVSANDRRVKLVGGLQAYEAAGGEVRRELFDSANEGYALNVPLLERLVAGKLESVAEQVRAEGWKWVECAVAAPDDFHFWDRDYPDDVHLSDEDKQALDDAQAEYDDLAELIEAGAADDEKDVEAKLEAIKLRIDAITAKTEVYPDETLARAGAFVMPGHGGSIRIERGLIRPEDMEGEEPASAGDDEQEPAEAERAEAAEAEPAPVKIAMPTVTHSAKLVEDLTAQKTAALRAELAGNPEIALAAVVHAMLLQTVHRREGEYSALEITVKSEDLTSPISDEDACRGIAAFHKLTEMWGDHIPGKPADLWDWCLRQEQDRLLELLAFAAAHSINAVDIGTSYRRREREHADQLGRALGVDMTKWFEPTAESYFNRVNRMTIELSVAEAKGADAELGVRNAKNKAEAVTIAARVVKGSGWLPAPIRIARDEADAETGESLPVAAE
ncbi:MAG: ParB/RepB/Spo0J family partition protein [Mesorhizobium sp.]|nr:ParB/RepB/Spo0J family partition protein [Mesorhizobium sp.]MCO5164552.1 ParB/RepB/Spo0J family partition protein [Mesorhizobium sp.]